MTTHKITSLLMASFFLSNTMLFSSDYQDPLNALRAPRVDSIITLYDRDRRDSEGYTQISAYVSIQYFFLNDVYKERGAPSKVLDIGAGEGSCLRRMLEDPRAKNVPFHYTAVEPQKLHAQTINAIWKTRENKLDGAYGGIANKDFHQYYQTKSEEKAGKFDVMFAGFFLHVMTPLAYLDAVKNIYKMLKPGGKLYLTQHSYEGPSYSEEYMSAVESRNLMPFWINYPDRGFSSDVASMRALMTAVGFKTISCGLNEQLYLINRTKVKYLAGIFEKPSEDLLEEGNLALYGIAAEQAEASLKARMFNGQEKLNHLG